MEHYIFFGLAAVVFGLLLLSLGPRIAHNSSNPYSSSYSEKGYKPKNPDA